VILDDQVVIDDRNINIEIAKEVTGRHQSRHPQRSTDDIEQLELDEGHL